jgi:putative transposase
VDKSNLLIYKAYRFELDPNNYQKSKLLQHAGTARFAFNWGLEQRRKRYNEKTGRERFTSAITQHKKLIRLKKFQFPWMYDVSKCAPQEALRDLEQAFKNFFRRIKKGNEKAGFPQFKKRGVKDSFRLLGMIRFEGRRIQLPRLGKIRLKEKRKNYHRGRILSVTISQRAKRWFVSCTVEEEIDVSRNNGTAVGVDLGVKSLAVTSHGRIFANPKALNTKLHKLKKLSRNLSRKKTGSKNRIKARVKLAKFHLRVYNIRQDSLHKLTSWLAKNHGRIVIEDLNVSGMMKNKRISRRIADVGFFEFRRKLEYKVQWYGAELILAPRFFPSSKQCSRCGLVKREISLSERVFHCKECGLKLDRDLNAAINLLTVSCTDSLNACGEARSPWFSGATSRKQEPDTN